MACSSPDPKQTPPQKNQETGQLPPPPKNQSQDQSGKSNSHHFFLARPPVTNPGKTTRLAGTSATFQVPISVSKSRTPPGCGRTREENQIRLCTLRDGQGRGARRRSKQTRNGKKRRKPSDGSNQQTANILASHGSKSSSWLDHVKGKEPRPHGREISSTTHRAKWEGSEGWEGGKRHRVLDGAHC